MEPMASPQIIPARKGLLLNISQGEKIKVINTHGKQVIDTFAFNAARPTQEHLCMSHTRAALLKSIPSVGDILVSNFREPMLEFIEDTTPGMHDTLIAACDKYRYQNLGVQGFHDSCTDNLNKALGEVGITIETTPAPLNLFMNIPIAKGGNLRFEAPVSKKGQHVVLKAEMDLVIVLSACPMDILPVNDMMPQDCEYQIMS
ncbi:MAG: hypothetical protein M1834_007366 [Cirrosporium novae-zelandiae]|nr:MAG: hypothetical protein M1834_007366 [Cirrosporium novae-zelandiae]